MKQYFDEVMVQMDYIDVLIYGATLCDENNIAATINTNLTGMMNTVATVLPYMDRKMGGSGGLIVNVTSVIGLDPSPVFCAYSASKFGVIGFTRSLAVSYPDLINVKSNPYFALDRTRSTIPRTEWQLWRFAVDPQRFLWTGS